jgi:hypothetical protein
LVIGLALLTKDCGESAERTEEEARTMGLPGRTWMMEEPVLRGLMPGPLSRAKAEADSLRE